MSDRDDFGAFVSGFVFGGLIGAAVALILAPQSGEETREIIRTKSIELRDSAGQYYDDSRARAEEVAREALTMAEDLQKRGQVILEEQKTKLGEATPAEPAEEPKKSTKKS